MEFYTGDRLCSNIPKLITSIVSGAFTCVIALEENHTVYSSAGACAGAIIGAVAGRATDCGILRGAGLGALAGAVLSVEVLEASRAYWCLELSGSRGPSSMADFVDELIHGSVINERMSAYDGEVTGVVEDGVSGGGMRGETLKKLPWHAVDEPVYCAICLQDVEVGHLARTLPRCHHIFHLNCVDKWLVSHFTCPVCRHHV